MYLRKRESLAYKDFKKQNIPTAAIINNTAKEVTTPKVVGKLVSAAYSESIKIPVLISTHGRGRLNFIVAVKD